MTRLTPGDEKRIREVVAYCLDMANMVDEADRDQALLLGQCLAEIDALQAEIATFRNASPSLCNCSECCDVRDNGE